jgi:pre-mRNA-splicing factor SYF1
MVEATNGAFERALVLLHKMPRIWIMWLEYVVKQKRITSTRYAGGEGECNLEQGKL